MFPGPQIPDPERGYKKRNDGPQEPERGYKNGRRYKKPKRGHIRAKTALLQNHPLDDSCCMLSIAGPIALLLSFFCQASLKLLQSWRNAVWAGGLGRVVFITDGADASGPSTGKQESVLVITFYKMPENSQKLLSILARNWVKSLTFSTVLVMFSIPRRGTSRWKGGDIVEVVLRFANVGGLRRPQRVNVKICCEVSWPNHLLVATGVICEEERNH